MKRCPKCGQTYEDKDLNFCFNDGELLSYLAPDAPASGYSDRPLYANDPPPTEFLPSSRITNETRWTPPAAPPAVWQGNQAAPVNIPFSQYPTAVSPSQTLAIVSLGLGVGSLTVGWCCYSGTLLGPAAIVVGVIALFQIKNNPQLYGGKGFAIAGIATAAVFLVVLLLVIIIYGALSLI
jgi:Domain of unknown function (DUF4190)